MPQTSVDLDPGTLQIGTIADLSDYDSVSCVVEGATTQRFGTLVKRGTSPLKQILRLAAIADKGLFRGITIYRSDYSVPSEMNLSGELVQYAQVEVMTRGKIVVPVETAVGPATNSGKVYVRCVVAGNEVAGAFRSTTDASDLVDCSAFAQWESVTTGAGKAILSFDLRALGAAVA